MSALEQDIRTTLTAVADEAPSDLGLLSRVSVRSQRRSRVRRMGALAGAVAVVAAVVAGVTLLPGDERKSSIDYAGDPESFFTDGSKLDLRFGWVTTALPAGLRQQDAELTRVLNAEEDDTSANWSTPGGLAALSIDSSAKAMIPTELDAGETNRPTTVRGHAGREICGNGTCTLIWQEAPGEWLTVSRYTDSDAKARTEAHSVAAHLVRQTTIRHQDLVLNAVPKGCVLEGVTDTITITMLTGGPQCDRAAANVYQGTVPTYLHGRDVTIAGHRGILVNDIGGLNPEKPNQPVQRAELSLGNGRMLEVIVPGDAGWNETMLRYFIEHLTIPAV